MSRLCFLLLLERDESKELILCLCFVLPRRSCFSSLTSSCSRRMPLLATPKLRGQTKLSKKNTSNELVIASPLQSPVMDAVE